MSATASPTAHVLAGRQHVFGYEQRGITALPDSLPAGAKVRSTLLRAWGSVQRVRAKSGHAFAPPQVMLTDTPVRRGVLLLCPENVVVLGGQARSLLASAP